jgi:hypothetical protein
MTMPLPKMLEEQSPMPVLNWNVAGRTAAFHFLVVEQSQGKQDCYVFSLF